MKKILNITLLLFLSFLLSSCFSKNVIEENQILQEEENIIQSDDFLEEENDSNS
jgi:hypothetical protein